MRQIVLDTETTGLEVEQQHRIIEIGCVEIVNRRLTGRSFHRYLNPQRDIDEGAVQVHGLTRERLAGEPLFEHVAPEFVEFIEGAELIIHNAPFDVAFLDAELKRVQSEHRIAALCRVLDSLALARKMHPGQRNNLDALCRRYSVDNSNRDYHGALLDARILADVYLAMTGGQVMLTLSAESDRTRGEVDPAAHAARAALRRSLVVIEATDDELAAHQHVLTLLDKASGGNTVWRRL
jgi:DNA polymerase-3 subunit epsilon